MAGEYDPGGAFTAIGAAIMALISGGLWWRDKQSKKPIEDANARHELNGINANDAVLENLVAEIERMKKREADFEARISELEGKVDDLTSKLANVRIKAIDCYARASECACDGRAALLQHLKDIIQEA